MPLWKVNANTNGNNMKERDFIKEFKSRFSGKLDTSKRMTVWPKPESDFPFVVEDANKKIGCVYLHYEYEMMPAMVWVMYLKAYEKGRGDGSRILKMLCDLADRKGVTLYLEPAPDKKCLLEYSDLVAWYTSYGFKGKHVMIRQPKA